MYYPAQFQPAPEGGFVVTFRDIPEAITQGDTEAEAREMAADALLTAMDFYFEDRRPVPPPSASQEGDVLIALPASAWAKVLLLNEMLALGVTPAELARRLGTRPQDVNRIVNLMHSTKIDTLQAAYHAVVGTEAMEVNVRRWLSNRSANAEAVDPDLRRLKEAMRNAADRVNALTDDDPRFLGALRAQAAAINELIQYRSTSRNQRAP